jgi:hypothetical protein
VTSRQGARVDIEATLPPPHGFTLLDVSIVYARCSTYVAAAFQAHGAAGALRDHCKNQAHARHLLHGLTFVPASVETYGHLGRPIMRHLRALSEVASIRFLACTWGRFLARALRELSEALLLSQGYEYRFCAVLLAKGSGRCPLQVLPGVGTYFLD